MSEDKLFDTFISESRAYVQTIESNLLDLEYSGNKSASLQEIFRAAHTVKGSAGIIRCQSIKEVAHAMESLLQIMVDDHTMISTDVTDVLLSACDFLNSAIDKLPDTSYGTENKNAICERLNRLNPSKSRIVPAATDNAQENDPLQQDDESIAKRELFFLIFESGAHKFAAPLFYIKEVLNQISIKPIDIVAEYILGLANLHGDILPIIDFNRRFGLFLKSQLIEPRIIVFKLREMVLGVRVDSLVKIFSPDRLSYFKATDTTLRLFCDGYYEVDGKQVHLVNIDTLFYRENH